MLEDAFGEISLGPSIDELLGEALIEKRFNRERLIVYRGRLQRRQRQSARVQSFRAEQQAFRLQNQDGSISATQPITNGAIAVGNYAPRYGRGFVDGMPHLPRRRNVPPTHQPRKIALFLCLDQTGSIGIQGAQIGVDILNTYGGLVSAIGFIAFGDSMCMQVPLNRDVAYVRSLLEGAASGSGAWEFYYDFYCDPGGKVPENGVDALQVAYKEIQQPLGRTATDRYIYLKTDNQFYTTEPLFLVNDPATVRANLENHYLKKTFLDFGYIDPAEIPPEDLEQSGIYSETFPSGRKIVHGTFEL